MIITFTNPRWLKAKLSLIVNQKDGICTSAENSIKYLTGQPIKDVIGFALSKEHTIIDILWNDEENLPQEIKSFS